MGQEADALGREQDDRMYRYGASLGETLVRTVKEQVERGLDRLLTQRAEVSAAAHSLVGALQETDKALIKASAVGGEWAEDLRCQRQQLVDALCALGGAPTKERP
jgi:hypothetical protein